MREKGVFKQSLSKFEDAAFSRLLLHRIHATYTRQNPFYAVARADPSSCCWL